MYDATEIFRTLPQHQKEAYFKTGFYLLSFFYYLYRSVRLSFRWFRTQMSNNFQNDCGLYCRGRCIEPKFTMQTFFYLLPLFTNNEMNAANARWNVVTMIKGRENENLLVCTCYPSFVFSRNIFAKGSNCFRLTCEHVTQLYLLCCGSRHFNFRISD